MENKSHNEAGKTRNLSLSLVGTIGPKILHFMKRTKSVRKPENSK